MPGDRGRPTPLHGQMAELLIDLRIWRRRAMTDPVSPGRIDGGEAMQALPIVFEIAECGAEIAERDEHVLTLMGCRTIASETVQRKARRLAKRGTVTFLDELDEVPALLPAG